MLKVRDTFLRTDRVSLSAKARDVVVRADKLFLLAVLLPTFLAILYYGLFASDVYVSESQFVVRSPDKPAVSGLGMLLKSTGFSNSGDEVYAARNFVRSRDALLQLNKNGAVERAYDSDKVSIFDRFNPLGFEGSFEDFYRYYQKKVDVQYDTSSSIAILSVRAFSSRDAYRFNRDLLEL